MLWPVHVQKAPQASEHLCPARLQTRCDVCCASQNNEVLRQPCNILAYSVDGLCLYVCPEGTLDHWRYSCQHAGLLHVFPGVTVFLLSISVHVSGSFSLPLSLWIPVQSLPTDFAGRLSEGWWIPPCSLWSVWQQVVWPVLAENSVQTSVEENLEHVQCRRQLTFEDNAWSPVYFSSDLEFQYERHVTF